MSRPPELGPAQPPLEALLARYLRRQAFSGLAFASGDAPFGEVVPHDAEPVQSVDPRLAWGGALEALRLFTPSACAGLQIPTDWPTLVAAPEPAAAVALATGNYPQLVRRLGPLMHAARLSALRPAPGTSLAMPGLAAFAAHGADSFPGALLVLGLARLAQHFDLADEVIERHRRAVPRKWRAAWANEQAALAWHRGQAEEALALWRAEAASPAVLFNRGMAALFLDRPADARVSLNQAVTHLADDSGWHHLGRLYLALAQE
jgi:hypothetical protein